MTTTKQRDGAERTGPRKDWQEGPSASSGRPDRGPRRRSRSRSSQQSKALAVTQKGKTHHLALALAEGRYVAFDIETTGGNPERNGITEIFAVRYDRGEIKDTFYSLVNPKVSIPPIVRRMTGINNRMVKDAPLIEEVMPRFVEFIGDDVLVSHNTIGDMKFLRYFSETTTGETITNYFLCTHLLVEKLAPEAPDKSLKGLAGHFRLPTRGELHRAEADAYLTLELFKVLLGRLGGRSVSTIAQAIRFQGDYESGLRLGWGVSADMLRELPEGPGVYFLCDHEDKVTFLSSAHSLSREVRKLQRFTALPRQLVKSVIPSMVVRAQTTASPFQAALLEAEEMARHGVRFDPAYWHQRSANFLFTMAEDDGIRMMVGPLVEGARAVLGPIRGGKDVQLMFDRLAAIFGEKTGKKGLKIPREHEPLLEGFLFGQLKELAPSPLTAPLKVWPAYRRRVSERENLRLQLSELSVPAELEDLGRCSGVLVEPDGQQGAHVYAIVRGLPVKTTVVDGAWQDAINTGAVGRELGKTIQSQIRKGAPRSLSAREAHLITRVAWWVYFGARRHHSEFVPASQLPR